MKAFRQLPLAPLGEPGAYGRLGGQPVLFDGRGLPCARADLERALTVLDRNLADLCEAVAILQTARAARLAEIDQLRAMETDHAGAA